MKRLIPIVLTIFALWAGAQVTGCAALQPAADWLVTAPEDPQRVAEVAALKAEAEQLQKIIDDKKDSDIDRKIAEVALKANQVQQSAASQPSDPEESPLGVILATLAALGVPGTAVGTVLLKKLRRYQTGMAQTVKGINAANPDGLNPTLKQALAAAQDEDTKKLVSEIKG